MLEFIQTAFLTFDKLALKYSLSLVWSSNHHHVIKHISLVHPKLHPIPITAAIHPMTTQLIY